MDAYRNINQNAASLLQIHKTEMIAYISQHLASIYTYSKNYYY